MDDVKKQGRATPTSRRDFIKSAFVLSAGGGFGLDLASLGRPRALRFGIVTDLHYADRPPLGTRFYRDTLRRIREAVSVMNQEKPDFLIELGDFKDQDADPVEKNTVAYLRTIESKLRRFQGPTYHVLGNHDMDSLSKEQFLRNVTNTDIPTGSSYYSFDMKGFHLIVLDANFVADGGPYDHGNFHWTEANIPEEELEWLRRDLAGCSKPTIVFVHQLLDGVGEHYIRTAPRVRQVLERSQCVVAVFQGHQHGGQYTRINGIHYVTMRAMVEGGRPEDNRFSIVEATPDLEIRVRGFGREASRNLKVA